MIYKLYAKRILLPQFGTVNCVEKPIRRVSC